MERKQEFTPSPMAARSPLVERPDSKDGARAIEVISMFEDAIVDARHFDDPRAGTPRRSTRALLAGGAAALGLALVFFLVAYAQVVRDRAAGVPASGGGFLLDATALLLVAGGAVAIALGLGRRAEERRPRDFTVGPDPRALLNVSGESLPAAAFPLLRSTGSDYELLVAPAMRGEILVEGGRAYALAELIASGKARHSDAVPGAFALPIPEGSRTRVELSDTTSVLLRPVPAPRRQPVPLRLDARTLRFYAGTAAVAACALAVMFAIPPDPKSLALERLDQVRRLATFAIIPPETPPVAPLPDPKKDKPEKGGTKGKLARGTGGKMGDEKSKARDRRFQMKGPADNMDKHLAQQMAREAAQNIGVLGAINATKSSPFASIFSTHETALGDAATDVLGNLVGTEIGDANGVPGGLDLVGSGIGGTGTGNDTVGLNRIGTVGVGDGTKPYGKSVGLLQPKRTPHGPEVSFGQVQTAGGLGKEIIRRVIRQHINEIKFCYDQALQRNPDLYGRVVVNFTISPVGRVIVSAVQQSTLGNHEVESCTTSAVRRWEFPKPERAGVVMVSYPFTFNRPGARE